MYSSGNAGANMCDGDMVFYWFRQMTDASGQTVLCIGEGPTADDSDTCNLWPFNIDGFISDVRMTGLSDDAYFLYGTYVNN